MDAIINRYCLSLLLLTTTIGASVATNETSSEESREPRVSGRIVKLYSGNKLNPHICTDEGFQEDPINCAVFYRCVKERSGKFTVFRYQCAPGTIYDPDVETCNYPRSTRRAECGGMLKPNTESSSNNQISELNVAELPRPISTKVPIYIDQTTKFPTTLAWTLSSKREDIPIVSESSASYLPSTPTSKYEASKVAGITSKYPSNEHASNDFGIRPTLPSRTTLNSNIAKEEPCTSDGFMGDSDNCRKFYRCVGNLRGGFIKFEFSCSESTIWDDDIQGCNHPWAVKRSKCGRSLSYTEETTTQKPYIYSSEITKEQNIYNTDYGNKLNKTIQQQLQISHGAKVTQSQVQISNSNDVIQNQTQIHYGDRVDKFEKIESRQNQTQVSNISAISQTQTQIDYGNKGVQTQLQIDHSKDSSQSQVQIQETTTMQTSTSTQNNLQNNNVGNNQCYESGFMGDSNDCKKFYRCVDNGRGTYMKFEYFCGDGTVWDPEIEACNHVWAVKHCGGKLPIETSSEGYTTTSIKSTGYYKPPTKTTDRYTTSTTVKSTEPTKSTQNYYQPITQTADIGNSDDFGYGNQINQESLSSSPSTTRTTTTTSNAGSSECTSEGFIGDSRDCKIFYRCVGNGRGFTKYEFKCGDGTVWDSNIQACNHQSEVKQCGGNPTNELTTESYTTTTVISTEYHKETSKPTESHTTTSQISDVEDSNDVGYGNPNNHATFISSTTTVKTTSTTTKTSNSGGTECISSGFIGDVNDCKIFYRCVEDGSGSFIKYEFKCGDGTLWDPNIEACNHAWAVNNCGGTTSDNDVKEETTTRKEITMAPDNNMTTVTLIQITTQAPTENDDYDTGYGSHNDETSDTIITTTKQPQKQDKCRSSGFMGDAMDCKKFYRCVDDGNGGYIRYEFACGEGTVWDSKIEACNHAWAVENCRGSNSMTEITGSSSPSSVSTTYSDNSNISSTQGSKGTDKPFITSPMSTSSTTVGSDANNDCTNSGFKGDSNDCKKFYRCVDNGDGSYIRYEFICGEGTVWDPKIEACNHGWAVEKCGFQSDKVSQLTSQHPVMQDENSDNGYVTPSYDMSESSQGVTPTNSTSTTVITSDETNDCKYSGFMGDNNDCNKFYRCVDNGKGSYDRFEFHCGEGTVWDRSIEACNHAWAVKDCGGSASSTPQIQSESTTQSVSTSSEGQEQMQQSTVKSTTINVAYPNNEISDDKCKQEGFFGNKYDCTKFYRCVDNGQGGFTKYDFSCGEGTTWRQDIQACDHKSSDKICSSDSSSQSQISESQSETTTHSYSTPQTQASTNKIKLTSESTATKCTSDGFFAHPNDCKKFIRCVSNNNGGYTKYEFSCGDGTIWVQEIQACDHDNDITSCKTTTESTSKPQPNEEQSFSTSDTTMTPSTESMVSVIEHDEYHNETSEESSTNECKSEGYFSNNQDCQKFYRCVDNGNGGYTKYDFVCGEGTAWDSNTQTCNHINEVESCSNSSQESQTHETTTNKNQNETIITSTNTIETTTSSSDSSQGSNLNDQDICVEEGYFGDSKDCKKFYRCVDNGKGGYTKYDFICGDGTIWDQDITNCNHPQDVSNPSCSSSQETSETFSTTSTTTTSSASEITLSTTQSSGNSQNDTDCSQESTKKPSNQNITCDKAGYYPNPNDCKKFYRCVDWDGDGKRFSVFHFDCGEGTIWDPALDTCNHEDSVYPPRDCSENQSENVGSETTTMVGTTSKEDTTTTESTESQSTISEQTTTEQSATNEPTTAQQSTTSEPTTTEQSYTNKPSTTQSSGTSEQTTTQQPTTSEQTTTQQSTTSEQTTTQQSTATEQTTTQQSTTSEQATTQQSTTSEQTTTQQSTTSEQTTTQQSTTSEQTTTQQSTISEQTTTQQSTTSEQTTTQQSTTSEQTTTQQSTTTEQTTTQPSTTTDETTTHESTTTEESSTTEQPSTTTDQTTTQESSNSEQTTEGTTTEDHTTTDTSTTTETAPGKDCPETEDDQYLLVCPTSFRRHPKYCNMFYQCTEDDDTSEAKVAMFKCPNNTIYDETQTQCVEESKAGKKCDGEMANRRKFKRSSLNYKEPIIADKGKQSCSNTGYFPFEKQSECSKGFLKCEKNKIGKLRGYVYQCPDGYIYWSVSKRCELMERVRDCKRSGNDWTGRWNIPVERRNIAK